MTRKIYILVIIILLQLPSITYNKCFANQHEIDSILEQLPTLQDTALFEAYYNIISMTYTMDTGIYYCNKLLDAAAARNNIHYQAFALSQMTQFYYQQKETDSVFVVGKMTEDFCRKHNNLNFDYFLAGQYQSKQYNTNGQFILAMNKAQKMYDEATSINSDDGLVMALEEIAAAYIEMEDFDNAIIIYDECLPILNKTYEHDLYQIISIYDELTFLYWFKQDFVKMKTYIDSVEICINNMEELYNENLLNPIFYLHFYYAIYYCNTGKLDLAKLELDKISQTNDEVITDFGVQMRNTAFADYYMFTGEYEKALAYNQKAIDYFIESKIGLHLKRQILLRARIFESSKNFEASTHSYKRLKQVYDSLNIMYSSKQTNELKTIYELDKSEIETEKAKIKLRSTRILLGVSIITCFLLLLLVLIIWNSQKKISKKNKSLYKQIKNQSGILEQYKQNQQKEIKSKIKSSKKKTDPLYEHLQILIRNQKIFTDSTLTRKTLADKLNTNENYLFDTIKKHHNITFKEYLTTLRLEYSCNLLSTFNSDLTIEAVAIDSGFGSRNTFYRLFRERYGLTPVEFRQSSLSKK